MRKKTKILYLVQIVFIVLSAFLVGYLLNVAQTGSPSFSFQTVFKTNVPIYLVTTLILFLIYMGLYGLINRFFYSTAIFYIFFAIYGVADRLKVMYRSEPILPSDLMFLSNIKELLTMVTPKLLIEVVVAIIVLVALCITLEHFFGKKLLRMKPIYRIVFVLLAVLSLGSF